MKLYCRIFGHRWKIWKTQWDDIYYCRRCEYEWTRHYAWRDDIPLPKIKATR